MGTLIKEETFQQPAFMDQSDCFGDYDRTSPICSKWCAVRLSCCIEHDRLDQELGLDDVLQSFISFVVQ